MLVQQSSYRQQRISSSLALDGVGNSSGYENRGDRVKYWEIIADNLNSMSEARL